MATIYTAIYRIGSETKEIELLSINPENYFRKYKNKLFCSEQNCHAKLCYVAMPGNKRRSYLRTWRNSSHVESCLHFTEVIKNGPRKRSTESITAIASEDQISNSLKQAFQLESMSEKELEKRREEDRRKRANRIRRNSGKKTEQLSIIELVTNPEELAIASKELKGGKLLKRNVDALKDVDLGKTRTVIGNFLELKHTQERTIIRVEKNGSCSNIKFEEAFFASEPEYKEMFHLINRFIKGNENTIIVVVGEVKRNEINNEFSVSVFDKLGLLIHGKRLEDLAREYSLGHFNF